MQRAGLWLGEKKPESPMPAFSLTEFFMTLIGYPFIEPGRTVLYVVIALFFWMAIRDFFQRENAIKRNFPLLGMARFLISAVGPELRQYLFANDREERPIPRYIREWIYPVGPGDPGHVAHAPLSPAQDHRGQG
jgi:hypothetical protein